MDAGLALSMGQTAISMYSAYEGMKSAKKVASAQKKTQEMQYKYNMSELEDYVAKEYNNQLTSYINQRNDQLDNYNKMSSKLNMYATQNNALIETSSYAEDMNNQLDVEFQTNLQNLYAGMENSLSQVLSNKYTTQYQLAVGDIQTQSQIDNALQSTNRKLMANVTNNLMGTVDKGVSKYSDYKSKNGEESSLSDFFSTVAFK